MLTLFSNLLTMCFVVSVGYKTESLHKFLYEKYDDDDTSPDMFPKVCSLFSQL